MTVTITWLGHATWQVQTGRHTLVIDPFFDGNPAATMAAKDVHCDYVLVSHGHGDHVGDAAAIANRCDATVISNYDLCLWLSNTQGVQKTLGMNLGGSATLPFGRVKMTVAHHSSMLPDGSYGGNPCGFVLRLPEKTLYFACDTALFGDMKYIGDMGIDVAVLPIGDLFTLGPEDALEAVKLLRPKQVIPSHYNTWPPIAQDARGWAKVVEQQTSSKVCVLEVGEALKL